jgi:uncharacterized protein YciI
MYVLFCLDNPVTGPAIRREIRALHLQYVVDHPDIFHYGGPLQDEAGATVGSIMILNLPDRAALDKFLAEEPYSRSKLYEAMIIRRTRQVVPEVKPGALADELARQLALTAA